MNGPIHFIWLGGPWHWQHWRAVETAKVHESERIIHVANGERIESEFWPDDVTYATLDLPDWLHDHPIKLANVKDYYAWGILHEHGGLYLDLDTISLRPVWDLLGDFDVCISTEFPPGKEAGDKHNSAIVIGRKDAPVLKEMEERADDILQRQITRWGATGPHLVTEFAEIRPEAVTCAPYPLLNGWSYHSIGDYYANPRDPGEPVRMLHLYSSDNLDLFYADQWMP